MISREYCLAALGLLLCLQVSTAQRPRETLTITSPRQGSNVPQRGNTIRFNSTVSIGATLVPVVLIKDPLGQWWPWLTATNTTRATWEVKDVQFGIEGDRGRRFQIQVLVIPQTEIDDGFISGAGRIFIQAGTPIQNSVMVTVLRSRFSAQSNIVTVTRR